MNAVIEDIYRLNQVVTASGEVIAFNSGIDRKEGELLAKLVSNDSQILKTLEVGCAYGLSSMFICEYLKERNNAHHTIVDPFQNSQWKGIGINNLKKIGFNEFSLIEEKSEFALPQLVAENEGTYDFVFIDGWHTFDHTLIDCFYGTRLLKVGGYLVVDDAHFQSIRPVINYFLNYPCFKYFDSVMEPRRPSLKRSLAKGILGMIPDKVQRQIFNRSFIRKTTEHNTESMVALKKISDDDRNWDWYNSNF